MNIVRAWKDETYRQSLSIEQQAMLPANPAGETELTDAALEGIHGACEVQHHEHCRKFSFGGSSGNSDTNTISQDVDQSAFATFGNKNFVINSYVKCEAENDADLNANIKNKTFEL